MENKGLGCSKGRIAAVLLVLFLGIGSIYAAGKFEPPEGKTLLFIGQDIACMDDYVKTIGSVPAGFMLYTSVQRLEALHEPTDFGAGVQDWQHVADNYPGTVLQIGLYMVDGLDDVIAGKYDDNIDNIGSWIKESKRPVYLRIGYEFDGPHNHYDPEKYVKAYRYIVDRFRKNGIDNVAYV